MQDFFFQAAVGNIEDAAGMMNAHSEYQHTHTHTHVSALFLQVCVCVRVY